MPKNTVVILHGYSDSYSSFKPLAKFLKNQGFNVVDIWLANYLSMYDEITIWDLGIAMRRALEENNIPQTRHSFDLIAHSTGGLVIREYLYQVCYENPKNSPVKHLVFLAPAHFGSPLAAKGQSIVGRFFKGWKWDGMFQTGTRILDALKLASPISWQMAKRDLFNSSNRLFSPNNIFATILIGTDKSKKAHRAIIHENGSDGVVRVSTANLNARYLKLKFIDENEFPEVQEVSPEYDKIAFGVLPDHDHSSITKPDDTSHGSLGYWILKSLSITDENDYNKHVADLADQTNKTFTDPAYTSNDCYHQYQTLVTCVHDQFGEEIPDHCIEFFQEKRDPLDNVMVTFLGQVLEKTTAFEKDSSLRSFLFDINDLYDLLLSLGRQVEMSLSARKLSKHISYLDPKKYITVAGPNPDQQWLVRPNTTLFVDIELPRLQDKNVFTLKKG